MEFTTTERGARQLLKDRYIYLFNKNLENRSANLEEKMNVVPQLN